MEELIRCHATPREDGIPVAHHHHTPHRCVPISGHAHETFRRDKIVCAPASAICAKHYRMSVHPSALLGRCMWHCTDRIAPFPAGEPAMPDSPPVGIHQRCRR
jgi:hypothetical protein